MEERIPLQPPFISPLDTSGGPLWSVMIPSYNCFSYLAETLESVLIQAEDKTKMQVEVVDDCSTDGNVKELVHSLGKGRIEFYSQPYNRGSLRNFETCINRARGKLVHILHGDDKVRKGFYAEMETMFYKHPTIGAAFCRVNYIDENSRDLFLSKPEMQQAGIVKNMLSLLGERQRIETPAIVVKRKVYENLGAFHSVIYGEDWEMWTRIAANYSIAYTPSVLAEYRRHTTSITSDKMMNAENITDLKKVMKLTDKYYKSSELVTLRKKARKFYALYAVRTANSLWHDKKYIKGAVAQLKGAFSLSKHPSVLLAASKIFFKILMRYDGKRILNRNMLL